MFRAPLSRQDTTPIHFKHLDLRKRTGRKKQINPDTRPRFPIAAKPTLPQGEDNGLIAVE
jgi:hypothetical protein